MMTKQKQGGAHDVRTDLQQAFEVNFNSAGILPVHGLTGKQLISLGSTVFGDFNVWGPQRLGAIFGDFNIWGQYLGTSV